MTYQQLLKEAKNKAITNNKEETAATILLLHATKLENHVLLAMLSDEVPEETVNEFNRLLDKYIFDNVPVQYLTSHEYFYGYEFKVTKDVLIPRPETEELVSNVLLTYDELFEGQSVSVVDIGTGSGAIAISLDLEESNMTVSASDISYDALEVAKSNAEKLGANVDFRVGDMLKPFIGQKFDILVSNPPYIPASEDVDSLVLDNEPHLALFGGEDGLKFYRIILEEASQILNEKNIIAFEHAYDKNVEMYNLAKKYFPNSDVRQIKDMQGRDRMTILVNK